MGPYACVTVFVAGFFAFGAIYHTLLWLSSRGDRASLAIALFLVATSVAGVAAFLVATADTVPQGQWALDLRTLSACLTLATLAWVFALVTGVRARLYLWLLTAGFVFLSAYTWIVAPLTGVVTGIEHVAMPWGERLSVLRRVPTSPWLWPAYLLACSVVGFGVICTRHLHRTDRVGGWLIGLTLAGLTVSVGVALMIDWLRLPLPYAGVIFNALWVLPIAWQVARRHRERERQLLASQQRFRAIFDQTVQFIGLLDAHGTLIEANQTALAFAGVDPQAVIGRKFWDTPWWAHSSEMQQRLRAAVSVAASGAIARFEATHTGHDGQLRYLDFSVKPVLDERGAVVLLIPEGRDITERIAADETRRRLEQRLLQAQKMEALGKLAGGVAHDFNNLLAVISGCAEMLRAGGSELVREEVEQIRLATERASSMIRQLLAFSRQSVLEPELVSLRTLVTQTRTMLTHSIGAHIEFIVDMAPDTYDVRADPNQLARILLNLVVNACDAMPEGGRLVIGTHNVTLEDAQARERGVAAGAYVLLLISDTGSGMTPETQSRLFEPFFTTKEPGKGTGLGLAVVDGIIRQSRGCIDVESALGAGTSFKIYLPAHEAERHVEPA